MRIDKLTTKFQEALGEAQTLALGNDHAYIEPAHVLVAMLRQQHGPKAMLQRAGVNVPGLLAAAEAAMKKLPQVEGQEQVQVGRDMVTLLQAAEKESIKRGDQFVASELFLLAVADSKGDIGHLAKANGLTRKSLEAAIDAVRGGQIRGQPGSRRPARSAEEIHPGPDRARPLRQAGPGDRPRRRDPPRHPGAAAPQQEQPGADRRARRGQDRHRRRPGPAHRQRRSARDPARQARAGAGHGRVCWPAPSTAASSRNA